MKETKWRLWGARASHCILICIALSACQGGNLGDANSLATAGQAASQSLQGQATTVAGTLDAWPAIVVTKEIMNCSVVKIAVARKACIDGAKSATISSEPARKQLVDISQKRAKALGQLVTAYKAFGDLASSDPGQDAANAISKAFDSINSLSNAVSSLPGVGALGQISPTITKIAGGVLGFIASEKQLEVVIAASKDLHTATDAMVKALSAEKDSAAWESLITELEQERDRLERSTLQAGLVSPTAIMAPLYAKYAPDVALVQAPGDDNKDIATEAASYLLDQAVGERKAVLSESYAKSLETLAAVSAQHVAFENKQKVDVSWIITEAKYLNGVVSKIGK